MILVGSEARRVDERLIVFAGDVHGEWAKLNRYLARARRSHGPIDAVLAVGDVQAVRSTEEDRMVRHAGGHEDVGDFPQVVIGQIKVVAPVYFIGGNHEPWRALDEHGPGQWAPNVNFLGRSGVTELAGLSVAFLSGIYSPRISEGNEPRLTDKARTYWHRAEVDELLRHPDKVDILLTHDWPDHVAEVPGRPINWSPGNRAVSDLADHLRPTVHAVGHHHRSIRREVDGVQLMALAAVAAGPTALAAVAVSDTGAIRELPVKEQSLSL